MQNKSQVPKLSPEMEKAFDEQVGRYMADFSMPNNFDANERLNKVAKYFLAQALQDQREGFVKEVEMMELSGRGEEYRLAQDHIIDILKGKTK